MLFSPISSFVVALAPALLPPSPGRAGCPVMMPRQPFKGGRFDDFLDAAEAERRFGPNRYAATSEDAWKIETKKQQTAEERRRSMEVYRLQKQQWLSDHVLISLLGAAVVWGVSSASATFSFAVGAAAGAFYLILKQREVDAWNVGAAAAGEEQEAPAPRTPPALVAPVLLILAVAKNPDALAVIPALSGFFMQKIAAVAQIAYDFESKAERKMS
mmetsp:Transcript_23740/g.75171  ORF Transcript_23740/g.75171 Transcript_23740/m.75171 type:complete len:215 (+) Transcript_23740:3-647(+)